MKGATVQILCRKTPPPVGAFHRIKRRRKIDVLVFPAQIAYRECDQRERTRQQPRFASDVCSASRMAGNKNRIDAKISNAANL
jgi:hypothetical protein